MKFYVGLTDSEWFEIIKKLDGATVNFWKPSSRVGFKILNKGDIFLFKQHKSEGGRIVGAAYFSDFEQMNIDRAWQRFGRGNGVDTIDDFREKIVHYRRSTGSDENDMSIGCIALKDVVSFDNNGIDPPSDWSDSIVSGKTYNSDDGGIGLKLFSEVKARMPMKSVDYVKLHNGSTAFANAQVREKCFAEWYSKYGTSAKMDLYFKALSDPNAVLDYRANHPARPEFHQDVDRSLFPAPGHSIYELTDLQRLKLLFENSNQVKTADDGSIKSGIGNYVMWLRLLDPETWKDEPFWDGDCVAAGTPTGRTRMATLLKNGFDYLKELENRKATYKMDKFLAAIRTKPFILLAGISGTGKSRLVRQLSRGCCPEWADAAKTVKHPFVDEQKPGNFEIIAVRPNWHDSTELMGYVTRITEDGKPEYVLTPFVKFLAKAWMNPGIPFFLCLDEMNLAPVEQYFAEYLSAIESRKWVDASDHTKGMTTDVVVRFGAEKSNGAVDPFVEETAKMLLPDYGTAAASVECKNLGDAICEVGGISIPPNLVVMGTVNMDETTCSFSRKVLDRAMTFELNDVSNMYTIEEINGEGSVPFGSITANQAKCSFLGAKEAVNSDAGKVEVDPASHETRAKRILDYIKAINDKLENTPFKIAYRSRDEIMIYCLERVKDGIVELPTALDEATSMKILSRIEGDEDKLAVYKVVNGKKERDEKTLLDVLDETIAAALKAANGGNDPKPECKVCKEKLEFMKGRLSGGFTNFFV